MNLNDFSSLFCFVKLTFAVPAFVLAIVATILGLQTIPANVSVVIISLLRLVCTPT